VIRFERGVIRFERGVIRFERGVIRFERGSIRFERGSIRLERGLNRLERASNPWETEVNRLELCPTSWYGAPIRFTDSLNPPERSSTHRARGSIRFPRRFSSVPGMLALS
jgi:hypothetical protein